MSSLVRRSITRPAPLAREVGLCEVLQTIGIERYNHLQLSVELN